MPITFGMKGSSYLYSQITGGVENAVPLHVDIPRTGGRGSDIPSEDSLQEYLEFPYECFLSVLPFEGYCCKLCPSNNARRKTSHGLRSGERAGQIPLQIILSPKTSDKACIDMRAVWTVAESFFFFC
jgi:hypothetical protein